MYSRDSILERIFKIPLNYPVISGPSFGSVLISNTTTSPKGPVGHNKLSVKLILTQVTIIQIQQSRWYAMAENSSVRV